MSQTFAKSIMRNYKYLMDIQLVATNPLGTQRVTINLDNTKIDTGYDREFFISERYLADILSSNTRVYRLGPQTRIEFGAGQVVRGRGYQCRAWLTKIEDFEFPAPGIDTEIILFGKGEPVLGLKLLSRWVATFDGPKRLLSLISE